MRLISLALRALPVPTALALCASTASAQFNDQWVTFVRDNPMMGPPKTQVSNLTNEVDFAWGDLDKDGWEDLVVVRKQPFTSPGKRRNLLLINENGVLVDRTLEFATATDVSGDEGFETKTNDRDVILVDVDMDGWLDVVTATTLSDGDPKSLSHPRIYMNLGDSPPGSGNWLGLEYQQARIPQLFTMDGSGNPLSPVAPRFCSVVAGDVTGDGYPDLYFGDYDSSGAGGQGQPSGLDLNNRLLVNDGNGFFVDSMNTRMNANPMLDSAFGAASAIADMNGDGVLDVVKQTSLNPPQHVAVVYNDPNNEGTFNIYHNFMDSEPYHISVGDLNNDGLPDIVVTSDFDDRYRFNQGNDALGRVSWGPNRTFNFLSGGDDGFGSNNLIADLDHDGWNDVLIADVDVDIGGFGRRLHIYHNRGEDGVHEGGNPVLREERTASGSWIGVVGLTAADLQGTHDVATMDIDNDGDVEMVIGRAEATHVWRNETNPTFCQEDLGNGGPGGEQLSLCGTPLGTGGSGSLTLAGAPPSTVAILLVASDATTVPLLGVDVLANTVFLKVLVAGGGGSKTIPVQGGSGGNFISEAYAQYLVFNPTVNPQTGDDWSTTNIVRIRLEE